MTPEFKYVQKWFSEYAETIKTLTDDGGPFPVAEFSFDPAGDLVRIVLGERSGLHAMTEMSADGFYNHLLNIMTAGGVSIEPLQVICVAMVPELLHALSGENPDRVKAAKIGLAIIGRMAERSAGKTIPLNPMIS